MSDPVKIRCPHCEKEFETDQLEKLECSNCCDTFLSIQIKKCKVKECENAYCLDCAEDNINEAGYCEECATVICENCEEEFDRDQEKKCSKCNNVYCKECAPSRFDAIGLCLDCTSETTSECTACDKTILLKQAAVCKDYDKCQTAYCSDDKDELNQNGYCEDCNALVCDTCNCDTNRDELIKCANTDCHRKSDFCHSCAATHLDVKGFCMQCSKEPTSRCYKCRKNIFESLRQHCQNCKQLLCQKCDPLTTCDACGKRRCENCGQKCKKCKNSYCKNCVKFKDGRCKNCRKLFGIF